MVPTWGCIKGGLVCGLWGVFLICCFQVELVCLTIPNEAQRYAIVAAKIKVQRLRKHQAAGSWLMSVCHHGHEPSLQSTLAANLAQTMHQLMSLAHPCMPHHQHACAHMAPTSRVCAMQTGACMPYHRYCRLPNYWRQEGAKQ